MLQFLVRIKMHYLLLFSFFQKKTCLCAHPSRTDPFHVMELSITVVSAALLQLSVILTPRKQNTNIALPFLCPLKLATIALK